MAKTMCPVCGAKMHVNTGDPAGFERKYPELMIVGYACRLCPQCAPEISEGDRVLVRGTEDSTGTVERVATGEGGFKLYRVQLQPDGAATYPRSKLAKIST
ncbi:hypothetical protein Pan153_19470 [Gimesia panareensis]|uniref:Uncharacterized protein n=1 Tax=Gimesia panareensis TaxID=2527978 RepID=A0A518FLS5_9PLAN|nr:hypothetical protein Pan153_19470 [Gimesia panareensis]